MLKIILIVFASFIISDAVADEIVTLFQFNGSLQCHESIVINPEESAQILIAAGLKVISRFSDNVPYGIPKKCGAPTGEANLLTVSAADWFKFTKKQPATLGFGVWVFDRPTLEIFKYDGTLQCSQGKEIPLETMAKELADKDIEVTNSRKGRDGLTHITVCGASTGILNVYTIGAESLAKAKVLGFKGLITQSMANEMVSPSTARRGSAQPRTVPRGFTPQTTQVPRLW